MSDFKSLRTELFGHEMAKITWKFLVLTGSLNKKQMQLFAVSAVSLLIDFMFLSTLLIQREVELEACVNTPSCMNDFNLAERKLHSPSVNEGSSNIKMEVICL